MSKAEAIDLAAREGLRLVELGGTGDGVIGALAGVGLTAGGNAGRFLEYGDGLRELGDAISAGALRGRGIAVLNLARNAEWVPDDAAIHVGDRPRPRLLGGQPVLLVDGGPDGWVAFDRRPPKRLTGRHKVSGAWPLVGERSTQVVVGDASGGPDIPQRLQRLAITPALVAELAAIGDGPFDATAVLVQDDPDTSDGQLDGFELWPRGADDIDG